MANSNHSLVLNMENDFGTQSHLMVDTALELSVTTGDTYRDKDNLT